MVSAVGLFANVDEFWQIFRPARYEYLLASVEGFLLVIVGQPGEKLGSILPPIRQIAHTLDHPV
ncbi:MAG: hypothetical protein OHK0046_50320 [Anaerolineae bacterium]